MRREDFVRGSKKKWIWTGLIIGSLVLCYGCQKKQQATKTAVPEQTVKIEVTPEADGITGPEKRITKDWEISEASLDRQIRVIMENERLWRYDYREEDDSELYQGAAFYKYAVTDLNQNGRLEILSVTYNGNGHYPCNDYFEVNQEMDGLVEITCDVSDSECAMTDTYTDSCPVYFDQKNHVYRYDISETDMVLQDGALKATCYSCWESEDRYDEEDYPVTKYKFYDGKGKRISPREWLRLKSSYFEKWTQRQAEFRWFYTIQEKEEAEEIEDVLEQQQLSKQAKKNPISKEELYNRLKRSYEHFGFRVDPLTVSKQLKLIADHAWYWMPWQNGKMADLEPGMYSFVLTDLDSNGRLEIMVSTKHGSGGVSENYYYEVNEMGDALVDITPEGKYQADWLGTSLNQYVYYYEVYPGINEHHYIAGDTIYHYVVQDGMWGGAGNGTVVIQDLCLQDGKLTVEDFAKKKLRKGKASYYSLEDGSQKEISKAKFQKLKKQYFQKLSNVVSVKQRRTFHWFKIGAGISEDKLFEKLETAYINWEYVM